METLVNEKTQLEEWRSRVNRFAHFIYDSRYMVDLPKRITGIGMITIQHFRLMPRIAELQLGVPPGEIACWNTVSSFFMCGDISIRISWNCSKIISVSSSIMIFQRLKASLDIHHVGYAQDSKFASNMSMFALFHSHTHVSLQKLRVIFVNVLILSRDLTNFLLFRCN